MIDFLDQAIAAGGRLDTDASGEVRAVARQEFSVLPRLSKDAARRGRASAYRRNPTCAHCGKHVASVAAAAYAVTIDRVVHVTTCFARYLLDHRAAQRGRHIAQITTRTTCRA